MPISETKNLVKRNLYITESQLAIIEKQAHLRGVSVSEQTRTVIDLGIMQWGTLQTTQKGVSHE